MGFKKYIIAAIILIGATVGYAMYLNLGDYTLNIPQLQFEYTLPIYIWIAVPAGVLFIATILHMIYYGSKNYFAKRAIDKDIKILEGIIKKRLLKENANDLLTTDGLKNIGDIIKQMDINLTDNIVTSSKELNDIIQKINLINKGKYLSYKELKLSSDNPFYQKNLFNRVKEDITFALDVLRENDRYSLELIESAFERVVEDKSMTTIKKILPNLKLTNNMIKKLLQKNSNTTKEFALSNEDILKYIREADFTNEELIALAKAYKKTLSPDQLIKLYEDIAADNAKFTPAYLYVLFDFQMIDQAKDILLNSQPNEYKVYKALLDLRAAGKHYSLDDLVCQ